jgi:signal transduction histidine kinase/ActR/RegA family two-component response regulator
MLGVNVDITEERLHQEELRKAYAEIEARVTERTAQLEAAKIAAENASKAKDLFLATLSHELRSPLSAILSWAQLMERGVLSPDKMKTALRTIKESAWAQNQLIGDLLDLSRIATGKLHVDLQPLNLADVLKVALESVRPSVEQHGLTIEEHISVDELYISADPARLKQSLWNVLSNAVKFTPSGGTITVSVSQQAGVDGDRAALTIRDTGKGIKKEFLPNIFERFSQADPSSIRIHGGMGLGLSLVHSLVKLQGGTVTAESPGEGLGATFTISFPLLATSAEPAGKLSEVSKRGEELLIDGSLKDLKVLLVEDGEETRLALEQLLVAQGADVQAKASAKEALATFESFHPDVIVSDIAMPQEDGHSFIRKIRALGHDAGGDTPALALTAYADPRDREQAFASGFQEYLNKPIDAAVLAHAIRTLTGSQSS